ncbi:MAG TPA: SMI1/KNR4 family protein, partial [Tepidisphaeraceae bacterium]|nr:SMI1/KNR4 family protein [Tepidisphaeraceae bacterium]
RQSGSPPMQWSYQVPPPTHSQRWTRTNLKRDLFFSVRLWELLKRAKVKGQLVRLWAFEDVKPSVDDEAWIKEKLALINGAPVKRSKPAARSSGDHWFAEFLQKNGPKRKLPKPAFAAIEKKAKIKLPRDYKEFIATVGPRSFDNVMQQEGYTANILAPGKLDTTQFRRAKLKKLLNGEAPIDGVLFASANNGDAFLFDIARPARGDSLAVWYLDHEAHTLEPFAGSFAECIERLIEQK